MGKMHYRCYNSMENVQINAVCDADAEQLKNTSGVSGNISGAEQGDEIEAAAEFIKNIIVR